MLSGYIELKAPGKGADPSKFKGHDRQQWDRFRNLPNLIYTDGIEWTLFRFGELAREAKFSGDPTILGDKAIEANDAANLQPLLVDFFHWMPDVPKTAKQLASFLAPLCRMLKDDVRDALRRGSPTMLTVARDWRRYLFPDANDDKFADSYAQTVTFALLLARSNGADTLFLDTAVHALTTKSTLLGRALQVLTDDEVREDVKAALSMLQRVIQAIPAGTMTKGKHDPWLHFYEDFLQEYDPKLRKDAGAYYTPLEVVHAQTVLVDDILRNRMNKPMGFAEGGVKTLDPAVGTGTYLLSIIDHSMERVRLEEGDGATKARASLLANSLYGFENMVGPYAVAALRMTRLLHDFGGGLSADGVQVFLSNTLESPYEKIPELPMMYRAIGIEHQRAKRIKEFVPVLVCIGNPPYDRHEAASANNQMSTGAWVRWGESKKGKDAILNDFIEPVKKAGKGGDLKNLYNLYVYFWRWALWKVFEQEIALGSGIVSFITASSFIEGGAFLGMRRKMRELCDEIWIIDLGGDGHGTRQDDNVFAAIQTPVAITIAVRYDNPCPTQPAKVHYARIDGSKADKLAQLQAIQCFSDLQFIECQDGWDEPFTPPLVSNYFDWPRLTDLMPWQHSGVEAKRTWPIAPTKSLLEERWGQLLGTADRAISFKESTDRVVTGRYKSLWGNDADEVSIADLDRYAPCPKILPLWHRTLDRQFVIADNRVLARSRESLWKVDSDRQFYFAASFTSSAITVGPALTFSTGVPDRHYFNGRGGKDIIPLFRDSKASLSNLHPDLLRNLAAKLQIEVTPIDWACYLYGVMAHAGYTSRFQKELTSRDVHVPITLDLPLFERAIELGKQLLFLHSYGERFSEDFPRLSGSAKCLQGIEIGKAVDSFSYDVVRKELVVGNGKFGPVAEAVWDFEVSGLKVVQSWLGYRMANRSGKKTSPLDAIGLPEWTAELTSELLRLLWILEKTLALYPEQDQLLIEILRSNNLFMASELGNVPETFRKPPRTNDVQAAFDLN